MSLPAAFCEVRFIDRIGNPSSVNRPGVYLRPDRLFDLLQANLMLQGLQANFWGQVKKQQYFVPIGLAEVQTMGKVGF